MSNRYELGDTVEFPLRSPDRGRVRGVLTMWLGGDYWEIVTPLGTVHRRYGRELKRASVDLEVPTCQHEPDEREI
jgi:hypothetical protein